MGNHENRIKQIELLMNAIVNYNPNDDFYTLVENNRELFHGLKVVYSTNNTTSIFSNSSLKTIENECSVLKKYFYGSGLLFYSDDIYPRTLVEKEIKIPLDYSLSLDSNAAEKFRVWENNGSLDTEKDRFESLVRFIKDGKENGFNFDYSFFIIENLFDSMKENNHRPFNTIRALKRFDDLEYNKENFNIKQPVFPEDRESAGKRAINTLYAFHSSKDILKFIDRRNGLHLILLKSVLLSKNDKLSLTQKMAIILEFTLDSIGKFAKTELYYAWKLLKHGKNYSFFDPIKQINNNSVKRIRGMAWDLFAIRYQETLASRSKHSDFYIPFFASFDNRFIELSKACPIRAIIVDNIYNHVVSVHLDEYEFQEDLNNAMTDQFREKLMNPAEKLKRFNSNKKINYDELVAELESAVQDIANKNLMRDANAPHK